MDEPETQSQVPDPTGEHLTLIAAEVRALHKSMLEFQQEIGHRMVGVNWRLGCILFMMLMLPVILWFAAILVFLFGPPLTSWP